MTEDTKACDNLPVIHDAARNEALDDVHDGEVQHQGDVREDAVHHAGAPSVADVVEIGGHEKIKTQASERCVMCEENPSKYTCPGCGRKTCCLDCVNRHKEAFSCTGKRDRTAFVARGNLSYDTLVSDYKFLEEVHRVEDVSKRTQPPVPRRQLPKALKMLIQQANAREITLQLMSPGMKRRKENSTRYDFKTKTIFWRVQWTFSDGKEAVTSRMSEHTVIGDTLRQVIASLYNTENAAAKVPRETITETRAGTETPQSTTYRVSMHQEGVRADRAVDFDVDISNTLGAFLKGKCIVEFPVFRVHQEDC